MSASLAATLDHFGAELEAAWPRFAHRARRRLAAGPRHDHERLMFVFKAAVVGAGTMGGEIAQAIATADIPVVLKDVDQKFVDQGLEKARSLWRGPRRGRQARPRRARPQARP